MTTHKTQLPLDSDGIPILTRLVRREEMMRANDEPAPNEPVRNLSTAEIANELLSSELFQKQLDEVASELSQGIRLQLEQALGTAIEDVVNKALDRNKARAFELIRDQLEDSLPRMLAKAMQDRGISI
jgi:hypothetical protein